jgi:hypothetical protein
MRRAGILLTKTLGARCRLASPPQAQQRVNRDDFPLLIERAACEARGMLVCKQ